jgi:hypothetical protein
VRSISMTLFLEKFKYAAAEGAVVELKLRLLAGKVPALQGYALHPMMKNVEKKIISHFAAALSAEDKKTLFLCLELRNKVLHADFHAARESLKKLGIETSSGSVRKLNIPVVSALEVTRKIRGAKAGTEGSFTANTSSTASGGIMAWFLEAGNAGDFHRAGDAFKCATEIVDRLIDIE